MKSKVGAAAVNWQVKSAVELQQQERGGNVSFVAEAAWKENLCEALSSVCRWGSSEALLFSLPSKND